MYTVIGHPASRAIRVIWMLEELGADYEINPAGPGSDEMKRVNPTGKAPALKDGDTLLIDSAAICQYLADKHGALTHKAGTPERGHQDSFTFFAMDDMEYPLWTEAKHRFLYPEKYRVPNMKETCRWEFGRAMQALEERFGEGPFVTGDQFTVPDLLLGHCAAWAKNIEFELPGGKVGDYFERVLARPARARATERGKLVLEAA
jgi:glutathione S-transferase